jgi:hypothetical protein
MKKYSAFSLIEISMVILIIGILIAGTIKGSHLMAQYKLSVLQKLTRDSDVGQIPDLVAWYETTLDESFNYAEAADNTEISTWYDIGSQRAKSNATQSTSGIKPKYSIDSSLGLPLIFFTGGSSQFLNLPDNTVPSNNLPYTIFMVSKVTSNCSCGVLGSGNYGVTNQSNSFRYDPSGNFRNFWWSNDLGSTAGSMNPVNTLRIMSITYNTVDGRKFYINGALNASLSSTTRASLSTNNFIGKTIGSSGANLFMNGHIGEIIIYNRGLKNEERQSVEKYLGKKFNITVTIS